MVLIRHPLSGTEYYRNDDGTVRVVKAGTGVSGTFDRVGSWLHGERRTADPALCMWVADGDPEVPGQDPADESQAAFAVPTNRSRERSSQ